MTCTTASNYQTGCSELTKRDSIPNRPMICHCIYLLAMALHIYIWWVCDVNVMAAVFKLCVSCSGSVVAVLKAQCMLINEG